MIYLRLYEWPYKILFRQNAFLFIVLCSFISLLFSAFAFYLLLSHFRQNRIELTPDHLMVPGGGLLLSEITTLVEYYHGWMVVSLPNKRVQLHKETENAQELISSLKKITGIDHLISKAKAISRINSFNLLTLACILPLFFVSSMEAVIPLATVAAVGVLTNFILIVRDRYVRIYTGILTWLLPLNMATLTLLVLYKTS